MAVGEGDQLAVHAFIEVRTVEAVGLAGEVDKFRHAGRLELDFLGDIDHLPAGRGGSRQAEGGQQEEERSFLHIG